MRFPDEIVTDADNDYYLVIKYKYGENAETDKFFGGLILTSSAERRLCFNKFRRNALSASLRSNC